MLGVAVSSGRSEHTSKRIRVALAEDHPIVRYSLRELLAPELDIDIVGEAVGGPEAVQTLTETNADILIVDIESGGSRSWALLDVLRRAGNAAKIIVLADSQKRNHFVRAMKLGCSGIVLKQTAAKEIVGCIRSVYVGGIWLDRVAADSQRPHTTADAPLFSQREREVLALIARGHSNPEIAAKLVVSIQTVKNHLHHMYTKIGEKDRRRLVEYGIQGAGAAPGPNGSYNR
jgi:DNA-binding NarL/FixJ family response regulator